MSVRVNLLPSAVADRNRALRQRALAAGGALVVLAVLGGAYLLKLSEVGAAEEQLATEQEQLAAVQAEVTELDEFRVLEIAVDAADQTLAAALAGEASMAGALQDLAAVMPADAELESINVTTATTTEATSGEAAVSQSVGTLTATGRTADGHAPGLERLLLEFDKITSFGEVFFTQADTDNDDAVAFSVEVDLTHDIRTNRYVDGLPEDLR